MSVFGKFKDAVLAVVGNRLDYSAFYPATVMAHAEGPTLSALPDDARIKGLGMGRLPLRQGLAGSVSVVPVGARCLIGFEAQDPARPFVCLWSEGSLPLTSAISAATSIALSAPAVVIGAAGAGQLSTSASGASFGAGTDHVAIAKKVDDFIQGFHTVMTGWVVAPTDGGLALKTAYLAKFPAAPATTKSANLTAK